MKYKEKLKIEELLSIDINGAKQSILIRSYSEDNPVILYIHGGPGMSNMFLYKYEEDLERNFIVIKWDQRGTGKSYFKDMDRDFIRLEQIILDAYEISKYLKDRFNKKIYIVAHSWGSIIGIRLIYRYPELFLGYIGIGQIVNNHKSEEVSIKYILRKAKENQDKSSIKLIEQIRKNGVRSIEKIDKLVGKYGGSMIYKNKMMIKVLFLILGCKYYKIKDLYSLVVGILVSRNLIYSIVDINLCEEIKEVKLPIYFFFGKYDYITPNEITKIYYDKVKAPKKNIILFDHSAHSPNIEEYKRFNNAVIECFLGK